MSFSVRVRRSATISLDLRLLAQPVRRSLPAARASIRSSRSRRSVSMTKGRTIALCDASGLSAALSIAIRSFAIAWSSLVTSGA